MSISTTALHFSTTQGQNPSGQSITLTNTGNAALSWNAAVAGSNIFAITPFGGNLDAGSSAQLVVNANAASASPGTLAATITLTGPAPLPAQKIAVDIAINPVKSAQPVLNVSPGTLSCSNANSAAASQKFAIANNGPTTVHWSMQRASADTDTSWLSFDLSSGELAPGESTTINIHCDSSGLSAGTVTSALDVSDSDAGRVIKAVSVTFTVS
jgi:hypothetical protein